MEEFFNGFFVPPSWWSWPALLGVIVASLALLGTSADWLVKEAVALSEWSGLPKVVIGATVVSLGTTTPEAAVSIWANIQGSPGMALGNAVGSIICDTGLILGLACVITPLPLPPKIINRQGWVQSSAGVLLIVMCWPWKSPLSAFSAETPGLLTQRVGFLFLLLLAAYLWQSVRWAKELQDGSPLEELEVDVRASTALVLGKLVLAVALVVVASIVLIPAVTVTARRLEISEAVIAATVVAFGTSLPELVTALAAVRRGHGDLAVGNVIGADVLNVLFVAGASAAVAPAGLAVSADFFRRLFPFMFAVLLVFRIGIFFSGDRLHRGFGYLLLGIYVLYVITVVLSHLAAAASSGI